jgi:hypothetical protein
MHLRGEACAYQREAGDGFPSRLVFSPELSHRRKIGFWGYTGILSRSSGHTYTVGDFNLIWDIKGAFGRWENFYLFVEQ